MIRKLGIHMDKTMAMLLHKSACLVVSCLFLTPFALAQPKPGKEKITVPFPTEYRWKGAKIPKDTKAIRGTEYTIRGKNAENAAVQRVTVTTIDRRYYPMKADGAPQEKWEYERAGCPESTLDIIDRKTVDGRTAILYAIKSDTDDACGDTIALTYIAEGPTAFHTVALNIPKEQFTPALYKQWCDLLLASRIE